LDYAKIVAYVKELEGAAKPAPVPAPPPVKDEFDMTPAERAALIKDISNAVWGRAPWGGKPGIPGSSAANNLGWVSTFGEQNVNMLKDILPRLSAIEEALKAEHIDIDAYKAAAKEAFEEALKSTLEVSVTPAEPTPPVA
jgi:hypothetical protein